ncbi:hypothetical protein [Aquimarina rhabdastrellae]
MKKVLHVLMFICAMPVMAQLDANALMNIPIGTTAEINAISTATLTSGAMVFNSDAARIYEYDGTRWRPLVLAPLVETKTGNYTLTAADNGNVLRFNSSSDMTLTVPAGLEVGYNVSIYQVGSGKVTITGAGGVTVSNRLSRFRTAGVNAGVGLMCTGNNTFHLTGDLKRN